MVVALRLGILAAFLAVIANSASTDTSFSPVIGVLAMPEFKPSWRQSKRSYLASSYVKFFEAQGARIVPIVHDAPPADVRSLLERVNGLVFPGGAFPMEPAYLSFSSFVFDFAVRENIPAWGECLGLLQFLLYTSGEASPGPITGGWDSLGGPVPYMQRVNLTAAGKSWTAVSSMSPDVAAKFTTEPWAWHSHAFSVDLAAFQASARLRGFWDLLAVGRDRRGAAFVDIVKAKRHPIVGVMWHPEKMAFEYLPERAAAAAEVPAEVPAAAEGGVAPRGASVAAPPRRADGIAAMAHLGRYFVDLCRSFRGPMLSIEEVTRLSVHNWPEEFTAGSSSVFESQYFFPSAAAVSAVPADPPLAGAAAPLKAWGLAL
eukprot:TRINITY_DN13960_c0_g1_i1.p1 TRINITY_DN13960_c0_g1~~TRINITY_DN13960_c0_g1_i1.p1  ORF type:complete len:373 (-),score=73.34 TRINITY_DN13960_c0_g1_i1:82-1200(-)